MSEIIYQIDGADGDRCGSFASNGFPVAERFPLMTQLLLAAMPVAEKPIASSHDRADSSISDDFVTTPLLG